MSNQSNNNLPVLIAAGLVLAFVSGIAGCKGKDHPKQVSHGEQFVDEDQPRTVNRFADAHIAAGARADSSLLPQHFDGTQLNSLGRQRLRYMLKDDDACEPLVVYIDLPEKGDTNAARQESVLAFLMDQGLLEAQVELKQGSNPASKFSTAPALRALNDSNAATGGEETPSVGLFGSGDTAGK